MALRESHNQKWVSTPPLVEYAMLVELTRALMKSPIITDGISDTIAISYKERSYHVQKCDLEGALFEHHRLDPLYLIDKALIFAKSNDLREELGGLRNRLARIAEVKAKLVGFRNGVEPKKPAIRI